MQILHIAILAVRLEFFFLWLWNDKWQCVIILEIMDVFECIRKSIGVVVTIKRCYGVQRHSLHCNKAVWIMEGIVTYIQLLHSLMCNGFNAVWISNVRCQDRKVYIHVKLTSGFPCKVKISRKLSQWTFTQLCT